MRSVHGIAIILIVIILAVFSFLSVISLRPCRWLGCITFSEKEQYVRKDLYEASDTTYRALFQNHDKQLRVTVKKVKTEKEADSAIAAETIRLRGIFVKAPSPYPGEISDSITCPGEFTPDFVTKQINGISLFYFSSFLTSRLSYGVCNLSQAAFRVHTFLFSCASHLLTYQLEVISSLKNADDDRQKLETEAVSIACLKK